MDLDTGNTYCLFFPYSPEHLVHSMTKAKDMKPHVSFSVSASLKEAHHVSGSASALLIGGFSVMGPNKVIIKFLNFFTFLKVSLSKAYIFRKCFM